MQLTKSELNIVKSILASANLAAFVFGSRARGTARNDSDLDICLRNGDLPVSLDILGNLREAFDQSDLPFAVDLVDYINLTDEFKTQIKDDMIKL